MSGKLARVRWQMGQTLLPDQFLAQEEALLQDASIRSRLGGLPAYGVAALRWNDALLKEGVLSIKTATIVFPTGTLLDIPGNAIASPTNLNVPGTAKVTVYLHRLEALASEEQISAQWDTGDSDPIARRVHQVVLAAEQSYPDALETLKLGVFQRDPDGVWELSGEYAPPLLQVGTSPYLRAPFEELPRALEAFQYKLAMDSASYLSGGSLHTVKQCLKSVYRIQRFLGNLQRQIRVHPYLLYETLKEFYVDVCFYRDSSPKHVTDPYNHDQLVDCFEKILVPLQEQLQLAEKRSPYRPFEFRDGIYRIEFPAEIRQAEDTYFLIQKSQVSKSVALDNFKMAAPSRLAMVHKLALRGIPITKVDRPMLAHSFGPEVEFYRVVPGEEWDHALTEGGAAFYHSPTFQELEFYLYWHFG